VRTFRKLSLAIPCLSFLLGSGCESLFCKKGDDVLDFKVLSESFWEVEGQIPQAKGPSPAPEALRVAIAEFTVEFADEADGLPLNYGTGMKLEMPSVLYVALAQLLTEFNRYPVGVGDVSESLALESIRGSRLGDGEFLANILGGRAPSRFPAAGLPVIDDGQPELYAKLLALLEETHADRVLQIRLRLGVRDGRASIEKGSIVRAVSREGMGISRSKVPLVSSIRVASQAAGVQGGKTVLAVDSRRYVRAMRELFRAAIGMSLIVTGQRG